jgi:hypothetical protein
VNRLWTEDNYQIQTTKPNIPTIYLYLGICFNSYRKYAIVKVPSSISERKKKQFCKIVGIMTMKK